MIGFIFRRSRGTWFVRTHFWAHFPGLEPRLRLKPGFGGQNSITQWFFTNQSLAEEVQLPQPVFHFGFNRSDMTWAGYRLYVNITIVEKLLNIIRTTQNENVFAIFVGQHYKLCGFPSILDLYMDGITKDLFSGYSGYKWYSMGGPKWWTNLESNPGHLHDPKSNALPTKPCIIEFAPWLRLCESEGKILLSPLTSL